MEIRNYRSADYAQVVSLWDGVFPNPAAHNDPGRSIERKVTADDGLFFVAADDGVIVGTVMAGYDGHRGWLYSLAVAPQRRRGGIGTRLVAHAERGLAARGCPKLNLQILADNADVVAFYESLGFHAEQRISMGKLIPD